MFKETSPSLPQELQDLVIDALFNDRSAQLNFSLVSKGWLRRARPLFFEGFWVRISIATPEDQARTDKLLELLETDASTLTKYTKNLQIEGLDRRPASEAPTVAQYIVLEPYLCRILPFFASAKKLTVTWLHWNKLTPTSQAMFSHFSSVETLTFLQFTFTDYEAGYDAIFGLIQTPTVKNLGLHSVVGGGRSGDVAFPEKHHHMLQRLQSLTIELDTWSEVRHPLFRPLLSNPCNLHTLKVICGDHHLDSLNNVLHKLGGSLRVLSIECFPSSAMCNGYEEYDGSRLRLSVSSNTQLEQLKIFDFELPHWSHTIPFLPDILSDTIDSIRSKSFKELVFRVKTGRQNIIERYRRVETIGKCLGEPFSPLDAILAEKKSTIPKIRIFFDLWDENASLAKWDKETRQKIAVKASKEFPNLCQNGQLAITVQVGGYLNHFDFEGVDTYGKAGSSDEEGEGEGEGVVEWDSWDVLGKKWW